VAAEIITGDLAPDTLAEKAAWCISAQDACSALWTGIFCSFWLINSGQLAQLMEHVWSRPVEGEEIEHLGARIWNLGRLLNLRQGITSADDRLPKRMLTESLSGGAAAGRTIGIEAFSDSLLEYYDSRGWNREGVPTEATLERLDVDVRLESTGPDADGQEGTMVGVEPAPLHMS
jgi:aldehyde:ferredoxin oxidoreductase